MAGIDLPHFCTGTFSAETSRPTVQSSDRRGRAEGGPLDDHSCRRRCHLAEVKATKGEATWRAYAGDLAWFEKITKKHYVDQLGRSDAMTLFAAGRDEDLNQKTISRLAGIRGAPSVCTNC